ncbi:MAG: hypothetical protein AAGL66_06285, partial [Pseudomonadota bacterium]
ALWRRKTACTSGTYIGKPSGIAIAVEAGLFTDMVRVDVAWVRRNALLQHQTSNRRIKDVREDSEPDQGKRSRMG